MATHHGGDMTRSQLVTHHVGGPGSLGHSPLTSLMFDPVTCLYYGTVTSCPSRRRLSVAAVRSEFSGRLHWGRACRALTCQPPPAGWSSAVPRTAAQTCGGLILLMPQLTTQPIDAHASWIGELPQFHALAGRSATLLATDGASMPGAGGEPPDRPSRCQGDLGGGVTGQIACGADGRDHRGDESRRLTATGKSGHIYCGAWGTTGLLCCGPASRISRRTSRWARGGAAMERYSQACGHFTLESHADDLNKALVIQFCGGERR